ncbi:MAG: hypothetical protein Q9191_005370 [Dirinaria sp. TL-2023a]
MQVLKRHTAEVEGMLVRTCAGAFAVLTRIRAIAAVAGGVSKVHPNHRPFSLVDPDISFPYVEHQKVSMGVDFVVALVAPAILIALIALIFIPGISQSKQMSRSQTWRLKLWEWNVGWMGLALSCAVTALFVESLKNLVGKPRPDLISRCDPDLANASNFVLAGVNDRISEGTLVSWTICRQTDLAILNDGFESFPISFAGLFYFALYLCSKFAVRIPYLLGYPPSPPQEAFSTPPHRSDQEKDDVTPQNTTIPEEAFRNGAAAPPTYLLVLPLIPICVALYISSTRYSDFKHHGFDIIAGSAIGLVIAWLSFRMYHVPVERSAGWAWRPRSAQKAFGIGVGIVGYVDCNDRRKKTDDPEVGLNTNGTGNAATPPGN